MSTNTQVIGIDPGLNGAIVLYAPGTHDDLNVWDMPRSQSNLKEINLAEAAAMLNDCSRAKFAIIEDVHSMPGQGVSSTFNFGKSYGMLLGALAALHIPTKRIRPSVWKALLNLSSDKKASIKKAKLEFPGHTHYFSRVKDDGRAEAALLAKLGYDIFLKNRKSNE